MARAWIGVSHSQKWADARLLPRPDCNDRCATVLSPMPSEHHSDSESERNETSGEPNIRERVERLKEQVSGLSNSLGEVEKTLEEQS